MKKDADHYRSIFTRNPVTPIGFTLAASAIYAVHYGTCEGGHHSNAEWQEIARKLRITYGETLTAEEALNEMAGAADQEEAAND